MLYSTYRLYFHRDLLFVLVISLFYRTGLLLLPGCVYLCVCSTELRRPISDVIWQLGLRKRRVNICPLLPLSFVLFFAFLWLSIVPKKKKKHRDDERSQCVYNRTFMSSDWLILLLTHKRENRQEQSTTTQRPTANTTVQKFQVLRQREKMTSYLTHISHSSSTLAVSCSQDLFWQHLRGLNSWNLFELERKKDGTRKNAWHTVQHEKQNENENLNDKQTNDKNKKRSPAAHKRQQTAKKKKQKQKQKKNREDNI